MKLYSISAAVCLLVPVSIGIADSQLPDPAILPAGAERWDPITQFKLGEQYRKGDGVPKNYVEAMKWYQKSAEQGYVKAQNILDKFQSATEEPSTPVVPPSPIPVTMPNPPIKSNSTQSLPFEPEMVAIPAGEFEMGSNENDLEKPVRTVYVNAFQMGKYEVTRGQFSKFVESTGYTTDAERSDGCLTWRGGSVEKSREVNWRNTAFSQDDNHPVVCVSWNDAIAYAQWLSEKTGKNYRLPTEAEWEYACRGGVANETYCGGNNVDVVGWYNGNSSQTHSVGQKQANKFGLYDMSGNVWDWTKNYAGYQPGGGRGGAWTSGQGALRSAFRDNGGPPTINGNDLGFRVAR
jgi:formylglycine-generating enzyme required for sulfatase activity